MKKSLLRKIFNYLVYSVSCFLGGIVMIVFAPIAGLFAYRLVWKRERDSQLRQERENLLTDEERAHVQGNEALEQLATDSKQDIQKKIWGNILGMDYDELKLMDSTVETILRIRTKSSESQGT